jgi:hypothetical protein
MNTGIEAIVAEVELPIAAQLPDDQGGAVVVAVVAVVVDAVGHAQAQRRLGSGPAGAGTAGRAGLAAAPRGGVVVVVDSSGSGSNSTSRRSIPMSPIARLLVPDRQ